MKGSQSLHKAIGDNVNVQVNTPCSTDLIHCHCQCSQSVNEKYFVGQTTEINKVRENVEITT